MRSPKIAMLAPLWVLMFLWLAPAAYTMRMQGVRPSL